ncbi:conjugal transfer protein [Mucilaginibacter sp. PPCGB 2223]|nr:conjugal transfer protein [Mucilaginibacter sp. PPCGB 2223]
MIMSQSAEQAKSYFSDALQKSDYYINDQELQGKFTGRLAERLGISGPATKEIFFDLCENINPATGNTLTLRNKDVRTVGYDINFHAPKSVSIIHALSKDDHILKLFEVSVNKTMREIEADAMTRVRKNEKHEDRKTGELVWAEFTHQTARPVGDFAPDVHLHSHAFVFNASWDDVEQQFKAGQFRDIKRDMPYYQARFHKNLSDGLIDLGYKIKATDKAFEIVGVPQSAIDLFSKRTNEIGQIAKEKGITDPDAIAELGARTRSKKQKGMSMAELRENWRSQLQEIDFTEVEKDRSIRGPNKTMPSVMVAKDCVDFTIDHSFERASVMHDRRLLANGYKHSIGHRDVSLDDITASFNADERIIQVQEKYRTMCTTTEILAEEKHMVDLALSGQGKFKPLYQNLPRINSELKGQQADAIEYLLSTPNQVSIVRGAAGAGKTTMLAEAKRHIEYAGKEVTIVAPSSDASHGVLVNEGFENATTVARLLVDKEMQAKLKDQVLIVDEAGMLGTRDTTSLLTIAKQQNARLIFVGDTRQHTAVLRGDALRVLNTVGGINVAEVDKIRRQRDIYYRAVVEDLAKGNVKGGFEKLENIGAIKAIDPLKPNEQLITDYMAATKKGKSALVVSPTNEQRKAVSQEIRECLKAEKLIGKRETIIPRYENLNYTEAQKTDWRMYKTGQTIQFTQNVPKIQRGSIWQVSDANSDFVSIKNNSGAEVHLPLNRAANFNVYKNTEIAVSKGDKVKITQNGFDDKGKRLNNGDVFDVQAVEKSGLLTLVNSKSKATSIISAQYGHIDHAYCTTSHASQGKTVDHVFISQPSGTFTATNAKQLYVSVSRGRDSVSIYTDDPDALLEHAKKLGDRQSAIELVQSELTHQEYIIQRERDRQIETERPTPSKEYSSINYNPYEDYEPGL